MESDSTTTHKISDSGYSHSTSNSNSHSSASSKSRNSGSNSSRSSGYCGGNTQVDINGAPQPPKRKKEKLHKQKKAKLDEEKLKTTSECKEDTSLTLNEKVAQEVLGNNETPLVENDVLNDANATDDVAETAASPLIAAVQPATEKFWEDAQQQSPTANNEDDTHKHPMQSNEGGFCCVISMYNGVILYTTPSLTDVLGFPKDMWLGRSFIDFVHPKDRETFSSQITKGIAIPMVDASGKIKSVKNSLYVCLRRYCGLKTSRFGVVDKAVPYQAFKLTVTLCHMSDMMGSKYIYSKGGTFLVVVAVPVYSSYKVPDEKTVSPKFCMRHTVSCVFSHVDPDVVTNFGFLPQDMLGKSIFDFYHPEDMPFMKEVYQSIIKMCPIAGAVFRSKPYRFAVQNGGFAIIETEWTSFVNPWSRRLEFVIGLHKVVQGPLNPNVFETPKDELRNVPEEVLNESKTVQEEILVLLNKVVPSNPINELSAPNDVAKQEISKCAMDLAVFMESLVEKVCNSGSQVDMSSQPVPTFSERDSAMLGDISPHHDYYDSKSSSETPPSYNQLNYNETLQRFFQSKPKTSFSDESNERTDTENYNNRDGNNSKEKCSLPIDNSGTSGSGSNGNLSSGSNCNLDSGMSSGNHDAYKSQLTEALLTRHNHDMEKIMYKKHKKQRHVTKDLDADRMVDRGDQDPNHGVKRYGSQSWEGENHKQSKPNHHQYSNNSSQHTNNTNRNQRSCDNQRTNEPNIWPPFSMSDTTFRNSNQNCSINRPPTNVASVPGLVPICCYHPPHVAPCNACLHSHHHPLQVSVPLCTGVHPVLPAVICTVPAVHNRPESYAINNHGCMGSRTLLVDVASNRATSHATSVNVEPGSGRGSTASVCGVNKAMTEGSRKDVEFQSVCSPGSPLVSPQDGESVVDAYNLTKQTIEIVENQSNDHKQKRQDDDSHNSSSCSSFYSQFLKTDTGSGSNDDSNSKKQSDGNDYPVQKIVPMRNKLPPWQENVEMRPDLVYRYQLVLENVENILRADLQTLKEMNQPSQVNKQLEQLYVEMELGGLGNKLKLDEATTSSSSSSDDSGADSDKISTQLPVEVTCRDICTKFSTILDWKEEKVVQFPSDDLRGERTVTTTRK